VKSAGAGRCHRSADDQSHGLAVRSCSSADEATSLTEIFEAFELLGVFATRELAVEHEERRRTDRSRRSITMSACCLAVCFQWMSRRFVARTELAKLLHVAAAPAATRPRGLLATVEAGAPDHPHVPLASVDQEVVVLRQRTDLTKNPRAAAPRSAPEEAVPPRRAKTSGASRPLAPHRTRAATARPGIPTRRHTMNPAGTHLEPFESVSCSGTTAPANAPVASTSRHAIAQGVPRKRPGRKRTSPG